MEKWCQNNSNFNVSGSTLFRELKLLQDPFAFILPCDILQKSPNSWTVLLVFYWWCISNSSGGILPDFFEGLSAELLNCVPNS